MIVVYSRADACYDIGYGAYAPKSGRIYGRTADRDWGSIVGVFGIGSGV